MNKLYLLIPAAFLLFLILMIILHFKKKAVIKKINALSATDKKQLLDTLGAPVGYLYEPYRDIFISRVNAPQKVFGYTSFYDFSAPYLNMVFDYETIYFNYNARTWLIEIWKGQYGINTGCELGIYYADSIVSPDLYTTTHFQAVNAKDMLDVALVLNISTGQNSSGYEELGRINRRHWWLTIFRMGYFTKPKDIIVNISIRFKDCAMMSSFLRSFEQTLPGIGYRTNGLTVYFNFAHSNRRYSVFKRLVRRIALLSCRLYGITFRYITRPFTNSGDRLIYLYYYLPFTVRLFLKNKKGEHS